MYKHDDSEDAYSISYNTPSTKISSSIGNKIGMQFGYAWHANDRLDIILSYNKLFFALAMELEFGYTWKPRQQYI